MRSSAAGAFVLLASLWSARGGQLVGWPELDDAAPRGVAHAPEVGATEVALHAAIAVTFSEALAPSSVGARAPAAHGVSGAGRRQLRWRARAVRRS